MATQPKTNRQRMLAAVATVAVFLTVAMFNPSPAMAQGCDTAQVLEIAAAAAAAGYYGVTLDLAACEVEIIFVNPSIIAPAAPVSPLPAPAVAVTGTTPITVTQPIVISRLGSPYVIHSSTVITALDYVRDLGERAPQVIGQTRWVAEYVLDAMKINGYTIGEAVYAIQLMANDFGAHRPANSGEMEQNTRYLVWYSNVQGHTLPLAFEEVYWDGVQLLLLTPLSLEMGEFTFDYAVAVQ